MDSSTSGDEITRQKEIPRFPKIEGGETASTCSERTRSVATLKLLGLLGAVYVVLVSARKVSSSQSY